MSKKAEERRKAGWKAIDVPTTRSHIRAVRNAPLARSGAFLLTLTKCLSTNWIQATSASSGISCAYCITRYVTAAFDLLIFAVHCPSFLLRSFYVALWTTHVTDTDWGVCSWPWFRFFFLVWEKPDLPLLVTKPDVFKLKIYYVVTDTDWGVCSWPWFRFFCLGETRPSFACDQT